MDRMSICENDDEKRTWSDLVEVLTPICKAFGTEKGFVEGEEELLGPLGIDETELSRIAEATGGEYFNVMSEQDLENVYDQILTAEKKKVTLDLTFYLLIAGLVLLLIEWILVNTRFKIIP